MGGRLCTEGVARASATGCTGCTGGAERARAAIDVPSAKSTAAPWLPSKAARISASMSLEEAREWVGVAAGGGFGAAALARSGCLRAQSYPAGLDGGARFNVDSSADVFW